MKRIHGIGLYKSGDLRLEVIDLDELEETVNESTAVFVGHTTVTSRISGQYFSDFYQVSRAYLKQQAHWRLVASQSNRLATTPTKVMN